MTLKLGARGFVFVESVEVPAGSANVPDKHVDVVEDDPAPAAIGDDAIPHVCDSQDDGSPVCLWGDSLLSGHQGPSMFSASSHSSRLRATGASSVHVERSCGALDDLLRDHDLLDTFETRQVEHGVKEYRLHDGAQPARPRLAVDSLPGDGAECFLRHSEIDPLHREQLLI